MNLKKALVGLLAGLAAVVAGLAAFVWFGTYHPGELEDAEVVCGGRAPFLEPGSELKLMSWNVQFMAGKNYLFFYDLPGNAGPDDRPSTEDIAITTNEVARVIIDEDPDVVLLQEVDDGARRTDHEDQLQRLLSHFPDEYACHASAFYWKAFFVPHPRIMGSVGMKLSVISKYRLGRAVRRSLPGMPANFIMKHFMLKRAVLEIGMPVTGGENFVVLDTHLEAFAQGTDTMERQVSRVRSVLEELTRKGHPWIIGGDFNLLPPGEAYESLAEDQKGSFDEHTQIEPLFERYRAVPGKEEVGGPGREEWFTYFSNNPSVKKPDRTIDYFFMSGDVKLGEHYVRRHDTLKISDHLPVIAVITLP